MVCYKCEFLTCLTNNHNHNKVGLSIISSPLTIVSMATKKQEHWGLSMLMECLQVAISYLELPRLSYVLLKRRILQLKNYKVLLDVNSVATKINFPCLDACFIKDHLRGRAVERSSVSFHSSTCSHNPCLIR
ncbi:hypothetical protein GOP47_0009146 [Adiantum capillus-veneris]|uniref:Uncharacterized protein n=1 Tax=Adiantum capillus-veneris TaxID=13818 RepID=A0A9D4ZL11_ADICA|nr:hypothetical protein GOP47_0009146 [Adiantum capillus-veneris]